MTIALRVDASRLRRWHLDLAERVKAETAGPYTSLEFGSGPPLPSSIELLLSLERLVHRLPGPRPSDRAEPNEATVPRSDHKGDMIIDLGLPSEAGSEGRRIRPRYDGAADEVALFSALLDGRVPVVEIEDGTGQILARGVPSIENAGSLCEAYESVVARVISLLLAALRNPTRSLPIPPRPPDGAGWAKVAAYAASALSFAAIRRLYHLCFHAPHWRVGWRFVSDRDVWDTRSLEGPAWNVLADPGFRFYADPFPVVWRGETVVFVEDFDHRTGKGVISAIPFDAGGPCGPARPVLEEPWHLSYPFLMERAGHLWMIPESSADRSVRLYRADLFPTRWVEEACLISDVEVSDATITEHQGRLWMFATARDGAGSYSDTLSIFIADDLLGPWRPHPANPILIDSGSARPAGNLVRRSGRLWRPVQDCRHGYGSAVGLAEVTRLDEDGFEQVVRQTIRPGPRWPGRRLHTLNRAGSLECIDGSGHSPKLPKLGSGLGR